MNDEACGGELLKERLIAKRADLVNLSEPNNLRAASHHNEFQSSNQDDWIEAPKRALCIWISPAEPINWFRS